MSIEANKKLIREFIDRVWVNGFTSEIGNYISEDYIAEGLGSGTRIVGIEGVHRNVTSTHDRFTGFDVQIDDMVVENDKVASRITLIGSPVHQENSVDNESLRNPEMIIHQIKNGKIIRAWSIGSTWR